MGVVSASPASHDSSRPLTLRACRDAARSVRLSPYGRQVRDVVRPHGLAIHRSRPPLAVLLYAAARDGRLVWRSANEFALLEPPIARKRDWAGSDPGRTWLSRLDRWWEQLLLAGVPFVLLLLAVPIAFAPVVGPAAMLLTLLAIGLIAAQLTVGLFRLILGFRGLPSDTTGGFHWTLTLCHVHDPTHVDRLLRAALSRSKELANAYIRPDVADGTHVLMCLEEGITTAAARDAAATATSVVRADTEPSGVLVVRDSDDFRAPDPEAQRPLSIVPLLLTCLTLAIAANAFVIADAEKAACRTAQDCVGRPATWIDAVSWLLSRMFFQDDHELVAGTLRAQAFGYAIQVLGVVVVLCLGQAGWQRARYTRRRRELLYEHLSTAIRSSVHVLVLVVLDIERDAVIQAVADAGGSRAEPGTAGGHAVFRLGRLKQTKITLAQATQGTVTPAAMMLTASSLIEALKPDYVVLAGICFGLWSRELDRGDQELGDVVVSEYVQNLDHRRVTIEDGVERILWRGERVQASRALLAAFRAATHGWTGPRAHVGTVLSANVLADSVTFRAHLRREFPEASAGEMELTGLYAAAANHGCGWIMAKGISDWGAGGLTDGTRRAASEAAAAFIVHALTRGTLPTPNRDQ